MRKFLFMFSAPANAADFSLNGKIVSQKTQDGGACSKASGEISFSANAGQNPKGAAIFSGVCAGQKVSLRLPAVDGNVRGREFMGIYAGPGNFGGQSFPVKLTVIGGIENGNVDGEAIFSFNDMVYNAGKFRGVVK